MKTVLRPIFSVLLILIAVNSVYAERLTLKQAVDTALRDNPALKSYAWSVQAQKEDVKAAEGGLYPKLKVEERFQRTDNPTYGFMSKLNQERFAQEDFIIDSLNDPDDISDFQTSFSFEQPLFAPLLYKGIGMAGRELEAKEADYKRRRDEITLSVIKTFNMVQTARGYIDAARKGEEDAREHKRLASLRYEAGTGLYSDVLRAEAALKKAEAFSVKAEGNLQVARRALGLILGTGGPVDVTGDTPLLPVGDLNTYIDASEGRDDLVALQLRHRNSQAAVKMEKSVFLPEVGLGGSYFFNDHKSPLSPEGESYIFMGFLRWNIFDASGYYRIKKARAKVHEGEAHLSGFKKEIIFRINEAFIRVKEKEQNLSLSRSMLRDAEEALRIVRTRYENSLAAIVDLLDTQVILDEARAQLLEAENERINAVADLYFQSGTLLKSLTVNE